MKKIMKLFVYVAAAAMTLASCQKNEIDNQVPQEYEYTFLIGNADTKAVIGDESVVWEDGDQMGVYTKVASGTISKNAYGDITPGSPATMKMYSDQALAIGDYVYAYYPYNSDNEDRNLMVTLSIPSVQDGKDDMPMVAIPYCVESAIGSGQQDAPAGKIKFANLGAVIEFNVYSTNTDYLSEKVQSVTYDAGAALAGNFEFDLTSVNYANQNTLKISGYEATSVVSTLAEPVVVGSSKEDAAKVKMVVAPGSYAGTITVKTDKATYTYNIATPKEYTRSSLRPLGADLSKGTRTAATTEEYTIQWDSASDWTDMTLSSGYYTVKAVKNNGSTAPTINSTKNDCRVYAKGSVIVTHSAANIKKLVFNISAKGKEQLADITASVGDVTIDTNNWKVIWEGDASSVTFTVGDKSEYGTEGKDKSGQLCFTSINAVAETTDAPIVSVLKEIKLSGMTTEYELNDEFSFDGTVTASYTIGEDKTVEPTDVSSPDMTTAGTKEVTITYTEGDVTCEEKYNITVTDPNAVVSEWIATPFADLKAGDQVVIVSTTNTGASYAMTNDNGTSKAPTAQTITYSNNKLSEEPGETVVWYVGVSGEDRIFYADASSSKWLYCTSSNNGIRVGSTNDAKLFSLDSSSSYIKHNGTGRYLGVYLDTPDWRCYTSINSNIQNQTFQFFVKSASGGETPEPEQKYLTVSQSVFNVTADQTSVTFDVNANVGWGLEESEGVETQIVGVSDDELVMTVEVTFPANETAEPKKHTVTFIPEELDENVTVTINQAAKVAVDTNFEAGDYWIIGVEDEISHVMVPFASTSNYAYAPSEVITDNRTFAKYAFTFEAVEGGFNIKASDERYYSTDANYKNFQIKDTPSVWTVSVQNDGTYLITDASTGKTIKYGDSTYTTFGVYASSETNTGVYPILVKADTPLPVELTSISVTGYTTIFNEGDPFVFDGIVTANYNDGSTKDVTNSAVVTEPNMVNGAEVTVSYTEGTVTKTFNYNITVKAASQGGGEGSEPVTVSKLISEISGTPTNGTKVSELKLDDVITASASTSGDNGKVYEDGEEWRLYMSSNGTVTISAIEGYTISTVKFTYKYSNNGVLLKGTTQIKSGAVDTVNAQNVTYTVGRTGGTKQGQVKVTAIEVVYQAN